MATVSEKVSREIAATCAFVKVGTRMERHQECNFKKFRQSSGEKSSMYEEMTLWDDETEDAFSI